MDFWQTRQVEAIFHHYLLDQINTQARQDRTQLDGYFRSQKHAAKLFTIMTPFVNHIQTMEPLWAVDPNLNKQWSPDHRPPWLPSRSVMRGMAYAPYILLLDAKRRVRESYHQDETLSALPDDFLNRSLPELMAPDSRNSITEEANGVVYLVTSIALIDKRKEPKVFLVFIAPMNDDFLSIFHTYTENNDIVVFINSDTNKVFASSKPDKVASGTELSKLQNRYMVVGKKFLDYGFSSNILIHFATLVPGEEIKHISNAILEAERKQRTFVYAVLAIFFITIAFSVAKSLQRFTRKMVDISIKQLKIQPKTVEAGGDQLLMMEEQFHLMTDEILHSRKLEETRRTEMQKTNDALHKSLVMVKRTRSQLVEAEKMASLGGLVAGVAHEINTPVGTGVTAASFLENRSQTCAKRFAEGTLRKSELDNFFIDVVESTQMILSNLLRAAELIRSFKQVAVDRTSEERRLFRMHEYIHHVLLSLHPRLKKTRIAVTVQCPDTLEINSYPGAFSQIITNLVVNSLIHGFKTEESAKTASGEILFHISMKEDDFLFRYSDNGQGMIEDDRARIFEPFFTTNRHRGGSGLGMHIVFNLVTQTLKGTIQCHSSPGQGTTFEINIPPETGISEA